MKKGVITIARLALSSFAQLTKVYEAPSTKTALSSYVYAYNTSAK